MTTTSDNEYNQRESANLMNIVAVVYGVALTTALSLRPDVLLHPLSVSNTIASLALLAAGLLTALSFFSYVLVIGGDTPPYRIAWNLGSSGSGSVIRFLADLLLAVLYVRLLFAAAGVGTGRAPELAGFVFAFIPVFIGAIVVRLLRRQRMNWTALIAALVALELWALAQSHRATHGFDLILGITLLAGVVLHGALNHWQSYSAWKHTHPAPAASH